MLKPKIFIMISKDFTFISEANDFSNRLIESGCGFFPVIKTIGSAIVVCRPYRRDDPTDEALYLSDGEDLNDDEPNDGWIYLEEQ